jgi:hypothetical protein
VDSSPWRTLFSSISVAARENRLRSSVVHYLFIAESWSTGGVRVKCLLLCKPEATLNDYWSYGGVYQKYAAARVTPPGRHCFLEPISSTLADLNNECLSYPETGLLYGYPVDETIALLTVG